MLEQQNVDYRLSFAEQGNKLPFSVSSVFVYIYVYIAAAAYIYIDKYEYVERGDSSYDSTGLFLYIRQLL